jgi:hypothetical protein
MLALAVGCAAAPSSEERPPPPVPTSGTEAGASPVASGSTAPVGSAPAAKDVRPTKRGVASAGPALCLGAAIPVCTDSSAAVAVSKLLATPAGATVRVHGTVALGDTVCTKSVPATCTTALTIVEVAPGAPQRATDPAIAIMLVGRGCGGPTGCCALDVGQSYVISGAHASAPGWAGSATQHRIEVTSVCRR